MTRKSGLHKKVSSIFGESTIPGNPPSGTGTDPGTEPGKMTNGSDGRRRIDAGTSLKPSSRPSPVFDEEKEFEASQRKKLILVISLLLVLGTVVYFNYFKPKPKTIITETPDNTNSKSPIQTSDISWPDPGDWPMDIKDPMARKGVDLTSFNQNRPKIGKLELRGIISGSMALIGTEIYKAGNECEGYKVKEILKDSVILEKPDGEKLELKMPDKNRAS